MLDRRDVLLASISAMAPVFPVSAFGQTTSLPQLKGEFLQRPGCRIYYEVAGSGPAIIFAHGLGSNHITWWQQVPYFADRYTCVTFSHRGFPPSSEVGIPDPKEFAADLGTLIEHLQLSDVRTRSPVNGRLDKPRIPAEQSGPQGACSGACIHMRNHS